MRVTAVRLWKRTWVLLLAVVVWCPWQVSAEVPEDRVERPPVESRGTPRITINVAERQLYLYDDQGMLVKTYPVAVGSRQYRTPLGHYALREIVWNAWWIPPPSAWARDARPTPPGKKNPLGNLKMPLGRSIMIHGTDKPRTIGTAASHGCIRMFTADAWELARWMQSRLNEPMSDEVFQQYQRNRQRSVHVKLERSVPVEIIYEYVAMHQGKLMIYRDVYARLNNKLETVLAVLTRHGYRAEVIDRQALLSILQQAKFQDVVVDLAEISLARTLPQHAATNVSSQ